MRAALRVFGVLSCAGACSAPAATLEPDRGRQAGDEEVRIAGHELGRHGAPMIYFGTQAGRGVVIESDTLMVVRTPSVERVQTVDVRIVFSDTEELVLPSAFAFERGHTVALQPKIGR